MQCLLSLRSIPSCFVVSFHRSEVNMDPRSVMISLGIPCNRNISLMKSAENCRASISLVHDKKCAIFVSRSMTIRMASSPSDFGKSVMKSMDIDFHGRSGASFGFIRP